MNEIISTLSQRTDLLIYAGVALSVMIFVEVLGLSLARLRSTRTRINKRLELIADGTDREAALVQLRRDRGLSDQGSWSMPLHSLNRLLLQSGVGARRMRVFLLVFVAVAGGSALGFAFFRSPVTAAVTGVAVGTIVPILVLIVLRKRRRAKFSEQLPEALDIMVRSMRAGHPIPIAVALVARELPDPIGTEFGMTADEMTYGLGLEAALQNMSARIGQQDLPFVVVAVSIQSQTGGNLAEVLSNLSRVIRDRFKLRRKVKAMSAEGRMSATALSLIPLLVFFLVNALAPSFYGDVKHDPLITPVATITFTIWATGVFIIYRLVNFKY